MITIARESRGMVHLDLAEKLNVTKPTAWRWENDVFGISEEVIEMLAKTLHYPESFFYQKGEVLPLSLSYRKRNVVAAKLISQIEANINYCLNKKINKVLLNLLAESFDKRGYKDMI